MIKTNLKDLRPRREQFKKTINLLSKGFSNPTAWPDGLLTVYPWDNETNDWLTKQAERNLSENGMLFGLVERLCNLNGGNIDQFVASEVLSVLLVARAIQNDCVLQYTARCPGIGCGQTEQAVIRVPDELGKIGEKTTGYLGYDDIVLPLCKDPVRIRPLLVKDTLAIEARDAADRKKIPDRTAHVLYGVVAVGGGTVETVDEVSTWYSALAPKDAKFLETAQDEASPRLDLRVPHRCDKCGLDYKHGLGLDKDFFR